MRTKIEAVAVKLWRVGPDYFESPDAQCDESEIGLCHDMYDAWLRTGQGLLELGLIEADELPEDYKPRFNSPWMSSKPETKPSRTSATLTRKKKLNPKNIKV